MRGYEASVADVRLIFACQADSLEVVGAVVLRKWHTLGGLMKWRKRTLDEISSMICGGSGNASVPEPFFMYRSSSWLTRFFEDAETEFVHLTDEPWGVRRFFISDSIGKLLNVLSHPR